MTTGNKIYDAYVGVAVETPEYWSKQYPGQPYPPAAQHDFIRGQLETVVILGDGFVVPREWLQDITDTVPASMNSVGVIMGQPADSFFPAGVAFTTLAKWREAHGMQYECYAACMDYLATGEGNTHQVVVRQAHSMGEFIAGLHPDVDPYFVQGMKFYKGVPVGDRTWELVAPAYLATLMRENGGNITANLRVHVNYS